MVEITPELIEFFALPLHKAIEVCVAYNNDVRDGALIEIDDYRECPIAQHVAYNDNKCHRELVPNIAYCVVCGKPICPDCHNHNVEQLSRVTGYLSGVSGWNESKKQEFIDRKRHEI